MGKTAGGGRRQAAGGRRTVEEVVVGAALVDLVGNGQAALFALEAELALVEVRVPAARQAERAGR